MAQQSTERACDRCRERRVKCDKTHPACLRCGKLGKPCPGYERKRKFVDEGVSLRKKYQTDPSRRQSGDLLSDYAGDETTTDVATSTPSGSLLWNGAPEHNTPQGFGQNGISANDHGQRGSLTGVMMRDESAGQDIGSRPSLAHSVDPVLFPEADFALQGLEQDAAVDTTWDFDSTWFDLAPDEFYGKNHVSCGFIPHAHIVDEVDKDDFRPSTEDASGTPMSGLGSFTDSGNLFGPESQLNTSALITDEREHEMAYLIRHFTESIGPWMDLFDQDKHFSHLVPLKALRDALLRNAIAAVAAKQLGRMNGVKPFLGPQSQKPAAMEVIPATPEVDWFYKAANYYDKAIAFSRMYLQALSGSLSRPPSPNIQDSVSLANSDDLLVAVSIFSLYESLDNLEMGWLQFVCRAHLQSHEWSLIDDRHLAGLKSLLSAVSPYQQEQGQLIPAISVGRRASFWNFARADYQAAYINGHQKTLLDTEDLSLWRSCGLQIQDDGSLYADPAAIKDDPFHSRRTAELVSHTLLWIILKVTNYLAMRDQPQSQQAVWDALIGQLDAWYGNLPETFQPCAQVRFPIDAKTKPGNGKHYLTEVFFSINQCAAAIQLYHFARILLLLNKPSTSTNAISRLKAYREVSAEAIRHARHIIGIALGRPHPAVRVEMILPLSVAGGCLESDEERRVIVDILRAIEKDTGCATENKVRNLMEEWGWIPEPQEVP